MIFYFSGRVHTWEDCYAAYLGSLQCAKNETIKIIRGYYGLSDCKKIHECCPKADDCQVDIESVDEGGSKAFGKSRSYQLM